MTNFDKGMAANGAYIRLAVGQSSQSVAGNYSVDSWSLRFYAGSNSSSWTNSPISYSININGSIYSGSFTFDFRNSTSKLIRSGHTTIHHASNGTKSISVSGGVGNTGTSLGGPATASGTFTQSTIPRKSSFGTIDQSVFGSLVTATINRASSSFTHTVTIKVGSHSATIATKTSATSVSYTIPASWADQSPNGTSTGVTYTLTTYSGSTNLGSTSVSGAVSVPASMVPTIGGITNSEATAVVASEVGAYVQSLSKLALAITGAAGVYGSTIKSYKITVGTQIINAASGVSGPLASSGTLTIAATVTDSRGRVGTKSITVTVLPYAPPTIDATALSVKRALAGGALDNDGTYLNIALKASVQSIVNGTQKNSLTYRISTREHGDTVWTLIATVAPGGLIFNGSKLIGTYGITHSWDVLIEVADAFATTVISSTVATSTIFMHWAGGGDGLGVGKYWEQGGLDVKGQIYQNSGKKIVDETSLATALGPYEKTANVVAELPKPQQIVGSEAVNTVSATSFAAVPNVDSASITLSKPAWVLITMGAWMNTPSGGDLRCGVAVSGALTLDPTALGGSWGSVMWARSTYTQKGAQCLVLCPAGTMTFTLQAYASVHSGSVNYPNFGVTPIAWA